MKHVPLAALEAAIIRPGIEKHLVPLLHFKGHADLGRMHRMWNLIVSMQAHEAETLADGYIRLWGNPEYSQLCLPNKRPQTMSFYGFLSRLQAKPAVAAEHPGMLEYARFLMPRPYSLTAVSEVSHDPKQRHAWWRHYEPDPSRRRYTSNRPKQFVLKEKPDDLVYPWLIHDGGRPEHELLRMINNAIPKHITGDLRADMCQDLAVAILLGDLKKDELYGPAKAVIANMRRMFPGKYGPISLDAIVPGTDNLRLIDTI